MKTEVPKINWLKGQYENRITWDIKLSNKKGLDFLDFKIKIYLLKFEDVRHNLDLIGH